MAKPSDETKKSVGRMALGGIGKSLLGGAKSFAKWNLNYKTGGLFNKDSSSEIDDKNNMSPSKVLGEIYNMMKVMEEDKRLNHEMANSHLESEELKKDLRNREIIKALTGRKKKKPVTPKRRKTKKEEEEVTPTDIPSLPKGKGKGRGKGKEPDKETDKTTGKTSNKPPEDKKTTDTKKTEADMKKAEADKKAKDAADAKKAEADRVANEKETKRVKDEQDKAAARQKQLEKEKADAKRAQEEADKKTAEATTEAERKSAERAKEEANRKAAEAEKKAAEEAKARAKTEAERKAAEEEKKRLLEEEKKRLAEEAKAESKRTLEATDKAQNRSTRRLKGEQEARKTAERLKAEKELARKKAEEEARRTAEQNKPAPPASSTATKTSGSPVVTGAVVAGGIFVSASALATMKGEQGVTNAEDALKVMNVDRKGGARKDLNIPAGVPTLGAATSDVSNSTSYGLFGLNNLRKIEKGKAVTGSSSIDDFVSKNPQLGLPTPGDQTNKQATEKFNKAWWEVSKKDPKGMLKAQLDYYRKTFEEPAIKDVKNLGLSPEILNDEGVKAFMADRAIQYGVHNFTNALKSAKEKGAKTPSEFIKLVSEYDKKNLRRYFSSQSDSWFDSNEKGLVNRIDERTQTGLKLSSNQQINRNNTGDQLNQESVQNQRGKTELKEQQQSSSGGTNNVVVNQQSSSPAKNTETADDRPSWYKKLFLQKF